MLNMIPWNRSKNSFSLCSEIFSPLKGLDVGRSIKSSLSCNVSGSSEMTYLLDDESVLLSSPIDTIGPTRSSTGHSPKIRTM